jgi:hypothetical protein
LGYVAEKADGEMSFTFASIAVMCAVLLFLSCLSFPHNPKTAWLNGAAMFRVRSILLLTTLVATLLAVVFMLLK